MNSIAAALALVALGAGPGAQRTGSAQFQVSVRVVATMRASAPATAELRLAAPSPLRVNSATPTVTRRGEEAVVARVSPTMALRGGEAAALIGVAGGPASRCPDGSACEVVLSRISRDADEPLVLTFLPDGAPPALVER